MALEKLHTPPQAPPMFTATPRSVIDDTKRLIEQSRKVQDQVVFGVQPEEASFANVLLPLAHDNNAMRLEMHILTFYQLFQQTRNCEMLQVRLASSWITLP
jgi:metallopeptidase MepB